jgi:hypothetical protein
MITDVNSVLYSELRSVVERDGEFRWAIQKGGSTVARKNHRHNNGWERAQQHIEEARRLSEMLGGTDGVPSRKGVKLNATHDMLGCS